MEGGRRVVSEGGRSVSGPLPYLLGRYFAFCLTFSAAIRKYLLSSQPEEVGRRD